MMHRRYLSQFIVSLSIVLSLQGELLAQEVPLIIPENASQLSETARYGQGVVHDVAWFDDDSRVVIATSLGVDLWSTQADENFFYPFSAGATHVAVTDAGRILAGSDNGEFVVMDFFTHEVLLVNHDHLYRITTTAWDRQGSQFVTGDLSGVLRLWDAETFSQTALIALDEPIREVVFADATVLTIYTDTQRVNWNMRDQAIQGILTQTYVPQTPVFELPDAVRMLYQASFTQLALYNADAVLVGDDAGLIRRIDLLNNEETSLAQEIDSAITALTTQPMDDATSEFAFITASGDVGYDISFENNSVVLSDANRMAAYSAVAIYPEEALIATGTDRGDVKIWSGNLATQEINLILGSVIYDLSFFSETSLLAIASGRELVLWDYVGNDVLWQTETPTELSQLTVDPTGRRIAVTGLDGMIHLYDAERGALVARLSGHRRRITELAYNVTGNLLVSASLDGTIAVWDVQADAEQPALVTLVGHTSAVNDVLFNGDGTAIYSVGQDGTIRVWQVES